MVWIKRNLFFVISSAVGLLLTGYCVYLLCSSLNANAGVSDDYKQKLNDLQMIQQKSPFPSRENIQEAKADQARERMFLADFRKSFAPFATPPAVDEVGFTTYLADSLGRFRTEATNAGVQLPPDFYFSFPGLIGKLTYPPGSIVPWMQQLQEINAILNILYDAKVNSLNDLLRGPVANDDTGAGIAFPAAFVTNQWGVVAPYKIKFRGFSAELAAVMEGFARSSNCFIIKNIFVEPTEKTLVANAGQSQLQPTAATSFSQPQYMNPMRNRPRSEREGPGGVRPLPPPRAAARGPAAPATVALAYGPPVTILSENPLLVTMTVEVIKLKASEH